MTFNTEINRLNTIIDGNNIINSNLEQGKIRSKWKSFLIFWIQWIPGVKFPKTSPQAVCASFQGFIEKYKNDLTDQDNQVLFEKLIRKQVELYQTHSKQIKSKEIEDIYFKLFDRMPVVEAKTRNPLSDEEFLEKWRFLLPELTTTHCYSSIDPKNIEDLKNYSLHEEKNEGRAAELLVLIAMYYSIQGSWEQTEDMLFEIKQRNGLDNLVGLRIGMMSADMNLLGFALIEIEDSKRRGRVIASLIDKETNVDTCSFYYADIDPLKEVLVTKDLGLIEMVFNASARDLETKKKLVSEFLDSQSNSDYEHIKKYFRV